MPVSYTHLWRQADTYNVPRMAFINKMDKMGADFFYSVQTIIDRLGKNAIPVQIPIGKEDDFIGLIDLFEMEAYYYNCLLYTSTTCLELLGHSKCTYGNTKSNLLACNEWCNS